jgi:hypothetical protein
VVGGRRAAAVAGFQSGAAATSLQQPFQVESVAPQSATGMSTDRRTFARSERTLLSTSQSREQPIKRDRRSRSTSRRYRIKQSLALLQV